MVMICPKCAGELDENAYCENCKSTITVYQKIKNTSKLLYNQGLQMARVRDISGAISVLQRSLKIDKNNTESRNLLGLLYFEIGETVSALQQWVISKNMKPENNLAEEYIKTIQQNQFHLDKLNNAIKKYNIALHHIKQNSEDLAIIQLKKVISINPKFIKAYTLLALCYINEKEYYKAEKILKSAIVIDKSNYVVNKYLNELRDVQAIDDKEEHIVDSGGYGIKPVRSKMPYTNSIQQVLLVVTGLIIGLAVAMFLIAPNSSEKKEMIIKELEEQVNTSQAELADATGQLTAANEANASLTEENNTLIEAETALEEAMRESGKVFVASNYYFNEEFENAANELAYIDVSKLQDTEYLSVYESLTAAVYPIVVQNAYQEALPYYWKGEDYRDDESYNEAITKFSVALKFVQDEFANEEYCEFALYRRGRSYYNIDEFDKALADFKAYIAKYPEGHFVEFATDYINELE